LKIENPTTKLHKKNKKFVWTVKCVEAFWRLMELLTTSPILKFPDMDVDFLVCTYTSKEGLGRVLMQDVRVIAYILRKLRRHEENYAIHNLELLSIVYAFRVWRNYLIGWKFELNMDHYRLQHIFMQRYLNARQRCWSEFLREYEFNITYIKGTMNKVVDALSRRPDIFLVMPLHMNLREKIITLQHDNDWYKEVKYFIGQNKMMVPRLEGFTMDNDVLLIFKGRIYVPPNDELRSLILNEPHRAVYMVLERNPPTDKWILSWILDPYDQDKKVSIVDTDFPFHEAKLSKEERRKKSKYLFTNVCPCSIQDDLDLQVLQNVLQYNEQQQ
jgi:hypothetical protein